MLPTIVLPKLTLTPAEQAELEIMELASKPELQRNFVIGGPTPPDMVAENKRRNAEFQRQRLAIIAKYGVADEYLKPLYEEKKRLSKKLKDVRKEIAGLEALRT